MTHPATSRPPLASTDPDAQAAPPPPPRFAVVDAVTRALAEDLTPIGDVTSALIPAELAAAASFVARESGVLAGTDCAEEAFRQIDATVEWQWYAADGARLESAQVIATVTGPLRAILTAERTALNFLSHLSGIATLTAQFVEAAGSEGGTARVWDTRKTTPGLRTLQKAAVRAGGGANHRGNLSDWVLIKDNHLALLGVEGAVAEARRLWPGRTVHLECDRIDQVREGLVAGVDALLLDNMTPDQARICVDEADEHVRLHGGRRPLLEVSGGVRLDTIGALAATGVDLVSVGAITNSAPVLDIGLDIT